MLYNGFLEYADTGSEVSFMGAASFPVRSVGAIRSIDFGSIDFRAIRKGRLA